VTCPSNPDAALAADPAAAAPVPPIDLAREQAELGPELEQAVRRVLASGQFVLGPEVERFEREFARFQGVRCAVGLASGTDALILGLLALGVRAGDRVLTSPFTFFASAGAIAWIGAVPRFADVELATGLLDPRAVLAALEPATTCLLPVHLYGQMADVVALRSIAGRHGLLLFEDAAQAHGARRDGFSAGQLGHAAAFSFYPTKNLGAAGDGGAVLANDEDLAAGVRRLRDHGCSAKYVHDEIGTNSRLAALQAALLSVKLPRLARWNARRGEIAARYDAAFAESECVRPLASAPLAEHVRHQYAVRVVGPRRRDEVAGRLRARGIGVGIHYPRPVHLQRAALPWSYREGDFPNAERLAREVLCLPIHPFLREDEVERVVRDTLAEASRP
jgi:dTDP-4-amino-4,6-dideoxygalactose transaminase